MLHAGLCRGDLCRQNIVETVVTWHDMALGLEHIGLNCGNNGGNILMQPLIQRDEVMAVVAK